MKSLLLALDPDATTPLTRQLVEGLRQAILNGQFVAHARLPSTRALGELLGVSRNTVHTAYAQLVAEGFLLGRQGAGTFVADLTSSDPLLTRGSPLMGDSGQTPVPGARQMSRSAQAVLALGERLPSIPAVKSGRARAFSMTSSMDPFPTRIWRKLLGRCWDDLQRQANLGRREFAPLKEAIAEHVGVTRGVRCQAQQVIIVSGSQQGIDLTARVLLDPGDLVWMEDPGYRGASSAFVGREARVVPVPVDEHGMCVADGEQLAPEVRVIHVTPTHQFPLGVTMPFRRRAELLAAARKVDAWILEDDYDSEFRYTGSPLASLQGIDADGRVLYLGSFSKSMFAGLRLAYVVVPMDLIDPFRAARLAAGGPPPVLEQAALAAFMKEGHYTRHLRRSRKIHAERQACLVRAVRQHLTGVIHVEPDQTGMHLVGWIQNGMTEIEVCRRAGEMGIVLSPLSAYEVNAGKAQGVLMGFSAVGERTLTQAVKNLQVALQ